MDNDEVKEQSLAFRFVQYAIHAGNRVGEYRPALVMSEHDNELLDLLVFLTPEDGQGKLIDFVQARPGDNPGQYRS